MAARNETIHDGFLVVMGTAGTGKSEIGRRLAASLRCDFVEADEFHTAESVEQMRRGISLTDAQRQPWLQAVCDRALSLPTRPAVIACSALKRSYRDLMRARLGAVRFLFLDGPTELIAARLQARRGHFASVALLESQLHTLERPASEEDAIVLDIAHSPEDVVTAALAAICAPKAPS
ncbi:gluconokinase [Shinella sp. DD12]|uniref:gluconokinase n=1 Tax=Shinella sp. DD12 TaxID=1410620 RepID=UPI0003C54C8D|nr:gluconokinase [Shinella sp. DD12]EYR77927.1 thermosensitive gluconokinase IdnK [Shinella sp. DD12]MCA0343176.1 gluconokinase [Pseudomonadota bacterium]